jgi:hypothetical protein
MSRKLKHKYVAAKTTNNIEIDNLMEFPPDEPPGVGGTALDPAGELATTIHTRCKLISRKFIP